ncbi:hypothetical protein C3L33_06435, partial [Rhododendron williamsianum]
MANFASFLAVFRLENDLIPDSLLGVCGTVVDSRREGLRAVVYVGKAVFIGVCQSHESIISIGNLVVAWAAAEMGWREFAICVFTLGAAHYLVLFVTLYQRLSGGCRTPARLRPVFFLFVAAPSVGSLAWKSISGTFDVASKMLFFLALFLFISLACRPLFFKKSMKRFSVAWWAYSFPVSFLALASAEYAKQVNGIGAPGLTLILSSLSILVFLCVMVFTALNTDLLLRENDGV